MPNSNKSVPADEMFVTNFIKNGGKFLYAENENQIQEHLNNIFIENPWKKIFINTPSLTTYLNKINVEQSSEFNYQNVFASSCEFLIAENGSILLSSHQLHEHRLDKLPENFIILAKTSQIISNLSESLRIINLKYKGKLPSNITAIKSFSDKNVEENNFMNYGNSTKNLYLLLLEDL